MKKKSQIAFSSSPSQKQSSTQPPKHSRKSNRDQFIYDVLGQQQTFKKVKTKQNLTKLVQLYRKLVQQYSQKNDSIQKYFVDKIGALSCQALQLQQPQQKQPTNLQQLSPQDKNSSDVRFKGITTSPVSPRYDPQNKKRQRSKNVQISIQVSQVKKKPNAISILKTYYEQWQKNNEIIMDDIKNQRKQLQKKLINIHQKSKQAASKTIIVT